MDESVSHLHSTGALISVSAICLAFIVSYLALKSRGRMNRRGTNHGSGSISVTFCKVCHQLVKNAPCQGHQTKGWTCSACSGHSHSTEVRKFDTWKCVNFVVVTLQLILVPGKVIHTVEGK